jgi:hypothetical protein
MSTSRSSLTPSPFLTPPSSSPSKFKLLQPLVSYAESDSEEEESVVHHPSFASSPTKAQFTHSQTEQSTATPQGSPTNKKSKDTKEKVVRPSRTTAEALKVEDSGEKKGLLKFFHKETAEEREQRIKRERVESDLWQQKVAEDAVLKAGREAAGKEKERFDAKMRKRKSRSRTYNREWAAGLRDENLRLKRRRVS